MSLLDAVTILFEDDNVLVINKPAGLAVHPVPQQAGYGTGADGKSVSEWFVEKYPEAKNVGEPLGDIMRPGIVHRIDRETSGVLILAKNQKAFEYLKAQFKNRMVRKAYTAFVYGSLPKDFETIDRPIGRSTHDFRRRATDTRARGELREAQTYYEVVKRREDATLVTVSPKTGRTHQIRVHFRSIGHPIVSDSLYAPNKPKLLGFDRLALHARSLELENMDGKTLTVEAPYPEDFKEALEGFNGPTIA